MSLNKSPIVYLIKLSEDTPNEVVEWFEFQSKQNQLEEELASLVHNHIKYQNSLVRHSTTSTVGNKKQDTNNSMDTESFFDNLYDWRDSYINLFEE